MLSDLSGLSTQSGGDWASSLTAGQIILVANQTTASQNGVYVASASAWTLQSYMASNNVLVPSIQGVSLIANSIYTCINGGTSHNIAVALLENKSAGCAWNGTTSVSVTEPASGQTYPVNFDVAQNLGILVRVTTSNGVAANVQQAILDYAAGNIAGYSGLGCGTDVSPFEIAGAILNENPSYYISKVEVSLASPINYVTTTLPVAFNQVAYIPSTNITVIIT